MINNFVQCGIFDSKIDHVWGPLKTSDTQNELTITVMLLLQPAIMIYLYFQ